MSEGSAPATRAARGLSRLRAGLARALDLRASVLLALVVGYGAAAVHFDRGAGKGAEARALAALQADLEQMTDILAAAMRDPLWQVSPDLGRPMLQAMFRDRRLVAVVVHEAGSEQPFLDLYRSVSASAPSLTRSRPILFEGRELGSIRVTLSSGPALDRLESDLATSRLQSLGVGLVATALALAVLHWRLGRSVRDLRRRVAALAAGDQPIDDAWDGIGEMRPLADDLRRLGRSAAEPDGSGRLSG